MELEWKDGIKFQVRENRAALICGAIAMILSVFIFIMWILHPSDKGGGLLLYLPLLCMFAFGAACLVMYFQRRLTVNEMDLCYVNLFGKRKEFTLDEIGYCKIGGRGADNRVVLYNLLGEKLCKLAIDMSGVEELHQYLVDNQVKVEWGSVQINNEASVLLDAIQKESGVCDEEIGKYAEIFYREVEPVFREWEKRHQKFEVEWEIGFAEYSLEDMDRKCRFRERTSSVETSLKTIPVSYACVLEAYLKCGEEYIVNRKGEEINVIIPYMVRSRSYRIGEGTRIRKTDERSMIDWLILHLEGLAQELPRHRYHTEAFTIQHRLSKKAGAAQQNEEKNRA